MVIKPTAQELYIDDARNNLMDASDTYQRRNQNQLLQMVKEEDPNSQWYVEYGMI
jgi:1,2-phenylacetyl-CoA epoxidase PaaB subunit